MSSVITFIPSNPFTLSAGYFLHIGLLNRANYFRTPFSIKFVACHINIGLYND